MTWYSCTRR